MSPTITVTAGKVSENLEIEVTGTFGGFFAEGDALYYVGAALIGLIAVFLLVLLVMTLRSGKDDDKNGPTPETGPSGPGPFVLPTETGEKEDTSWMVEHSVDDDGTEWAQDEKSTW